MILKKYKMEYNEKNKVNLLKKITKKININNKKGHKRMEELKWQYYYQEEQVL